MKKGILANPTSVNFYLPVALSSPIEKISFEIGANELARISDKRINAAQTKDQLQANIERSFMKLSRLMSVQNRDQKPLLKI